MSKFTFKFEEQSVNAVNKSITVEFNALSLNSILNEVTDFLKGCGYRFKGYVDIVEDDDPYMDTSEEDLNQINLDLYDNMTTNSENTIFHHPV